MMPIRQGLPRGFSLIEMIIVIVVLGIASVAVVTMVAGLGARQEDNRDLQVGTQLLQECGEWIVSNHRRNRCFYQNELVATSSSCYGLGDLSVSPYGGYNSRAVVTDTTYTGSECPSGAQCALSTITVAKSGFQLNPVNIMLVKYNTEPCT
jgi:prepilin-type N-terminal cleavage/methylation domain-containing protein